MTQPPEPGVQPSGPPAPSVPATPTSGYGVPPTHLPAGLAPDGRRLAEFGERLLAWLIDAAILTAATLVLAVPAVIVAFALLRNDLPGDEATMSDLLSQFLVILGVDLVVIAGSMTFSYVYFVEWFFRTGQTVGKRTMNIVVVPIEPTQPGLTRGIAAKRWLVKDVGGAIIPFFSLVDGLWQLWDQPFRQCLHDKVAETVVVKAARP
ncbi:MAG TPA: RDD family protein [Micromonosporaceae bacterium]|nr:RDD family protein [Micromonosporaceae bacterium]